MKPRNIFPYSYQIIHSSYFMIFYESKLRDMLKPVNVGSLCIYSRLSGNAVNKQDKAEKFEIRSTDHLQQPLFS